MIARAAWLGLAVATSACGYRAAYGEGGVGERLAVVLVRARVADAVAAGDVASGVREELARQGALRAGSGYPRVEVEVTRIDEISDGIAAVTAPGGGRVPLERASEVGVVARGWVARAPGGAEERDTGDVRVLVDVGTTPARGSTASSDATAIDAFQHDDAVRAAARRAGVRIAARVLGRPAPGVDEEGEGPAR